MSSSSGGRQILLHGMLMILAGMVWGLIIPMIPFPRLALVAHIQLELNGLLFVVLAVLLLTLPHRVGKTSLRIMLLAVWLTWGMALSEVANAWWGTTQILSIAASQAGATGGTPWQELVVKLTHITAGLGLIVAWFLLIVGFWRHIDPTGTDT